MLGNYKLKFSDVVLPRNEAEFAKLLGMHINELVVKRGFKSETDFYKAIDVTYGKWRRIKLGENYSSDKHAASPVYSVPLDTMCTIASILGTDVATIAEELNKLTPLCRKYTNKTVEQAKSENFVKVRRAPPPKKKKKVVKSDVNNDAYLVNLAIIILETMVSLGITRTILTRKTGYNTTTIWGALPVSDAIPTAFNIKVYLKIAEVLNVPFHELSRQAHERSYPFTEEPNIQKEEPIIEEKVKEPAPVIRLKYDLLKWLKPKFK